MRLSRSFPAPIAAAILSLLLPACGGPEDTAAAGSAYDVQRYDLHGTYDWDRGRLIATVGVTLTPTAPSLSRVVLDSAVTEVKAVRAEGLALPFSVDADARTLAIDLRDLPARGEGEPLEIVIDYEAASGRGLLALPARAGDPAASRALYTSSEPTGARTWMPCHDRPDDRAVFSADLTVGDDESVIANGDLELDARDASGHHVRHATRYPLPTYLMAFAVGTFEVERGNQGDVPIAVWHRRGVPGDYPKLIGEIGREIEAFSAKLGHYPFEKYALVMLPEFPGGMENAGITFQSETSSAEPMLSGDVSLGAHELGHQWFGDLVTVATWNDVWIKEGMATLLSAEAGRLYEDEGGAGTLLGDAFEPQDGKAIRDTSLAPGDKYTSGPYDRAAWLLTQIRAVAGDHAFWSTLRHTLDQHRFGVISTDELLAAFAPFLGPEATARAKRAVDAKALPKIDVAQADGGEAVLTLHDPEQILVAPLTIAWHREDGSVEEETLVPELPRALHRESAGDFLVIDPRDVHPAIETFFADDATWDRYASLVAPLRAPLSAAATPRFLELPGVHARAAIADGALPPVAPAELASFVAALDSEAAKALAIRAACTAAGAEDDPIEKLAWTAAITDALRAEPHYAGLGWVDSYDACAPLADPATLYASDWMALAKGDASLSEPRLVFLSKLTLPPATALAAWGGLVEHGASPRARVIGARKLARQAARLDDTAAADRAAWRARVADLLAESEVASVLAPLIRAAVALEADTAGDNAALLAALAEVLRSPATWAVQEQAVCAAVTLTAGDADALRSFREGVGGAPLTDDASALLADPSGCEG
jgi:hypothetical protein